MPKLEYYYKKTCPFCLKVTKFINKNDLKDKIEFKDIEEKEEYVNELVSVGGSKQVPCLFIDGKPMYESSDIIAYLKDNIA